MVKTVYENHMKKIEKGGLYVAYTVIGNYIQTALKFFKYSGLDRQWSYRQV